MEPAKVGRPAGSAPGFGGVAISRQRINHAFLRDLTRFWEEKGPSVIDRVANETPGTLLKCLTMLVPRELKIEHGNPTGALSDEQLQLMISELEERIGARLQGESAKVINGKAIEAPPKRKRPSTGKREYIVGSTKPEAVRKARYRAKLRAAKAVGNSGESGA